ncbi:MAG TPA: hypothetical protein VMI94_28665 [Bryobacteraceae bacterium]|nr:hypothetical protein [Bryobacteraceae bacterium]
MIRTAIDLACNVTHALQMYPPDYIRSVLGNPDSWCIQTCPPTELQLAACQEWSKGLPALAHILVPALPWRPPGLNLPCADLLFRPSSVFRYPAGRDVPDPTPRERWFFINGICTDRGVVRLNAEYLHHLFERPLTVLHNYTRGWLPDLAACAVGKEWSRVTESATVAFPPIYAALKDRRCQRLILLAHSQGTILSAVILETLKELYPAAYAERAAAVTVAPEHAVARRLAQRWNFAGTMRAAQTGRKHPPAAPAAFEWPGYGLRHPEPVTLAEWRKLEIYCFANCASVMLPVETIGRKRIPVPWIESYGNEKDIVARLGVLANATGPGSVEIGGERYQRDGAWGHLLNAHYLYPMIESRRRKDPAGGFVPLAGRRASIPRLFAYLNAKSPPPLAANKIE